MSFRALKFLYGMVMLLLLCLPTQAVAEVWVFFRPDIPLHVDTVECLRAKIGQSLVFCPVGKTSFSFLESRPPEFVVALGDTALHLALQMPWKVKILVTLVDQPPSDSRTMFLNTEQPHAMQIKLLQTLVPNIDTIWHPYVSERFASANTLGLVTETSGLKITSCSLKNPHVLPQALRILEQRIAAVILPPDPGIMNNATIQSILLASFRSRTPVVGFSEGLVKQGAAFAYVLSPENLAAAISEISDEVINNAGSHKAIRVFDRWNLILNLTILEKFGMHPSEQLKNAASKLF